jgi:hypothetical protein
MASAIEAMSAGHEAVGRIGQRTPAGAALSSLWTAIERRLARAPKAR